MRLKKSMSILMCMGLTCSVHTAAVNAEQMSTVPQWTCDFDFKADTDGYSKSFDGSTDSRMHTPFDTEVSPRTGDNSAAVTEGLRTIGMSGITAANAKLGFCAAGKTSNMKLAAYNNDGAYGAFYIKLNESAADNNFALGVNAVKNYKSSEKTVTFTRDTVKPDSNQTLIMTYDNIAYVADNNDNTKTGYTIVSLKSSNDAEIINYTAAYKGTSADDAVLKNIKIGGTAVEGEITKVASIQSDGSYLNSVSSYADGKTTNGKITITMTADGTTTFAYTTPAGVTSIFKGNVSDASIAKLVITAKNDDSSRMYCIDNLVTTISESDKPSEVAAADKYDFETDAELDYSDTIGFTASFVPKETTINSLTWYLSNDGGNHYTELTKGILPEITGDGTSEVNVGLIVYNLPTSANELSAGYSVE